MAGPHDSSRNDLLINARLRLQSPTAPGQPMSPTDLANLMRAYLWEQAGLASDIDHRYIWRYESGNQRWPHEPHRAAFRSVLQVDTDAELGFYPHRTRHTHPRPSPASRPHNTPSPTAPTPATLNTGGTTVATMPPTVQLLTPHSSSRHRFGAELRTLRMERGLSVEDLSGLLSEQPDLLARVEEALQWPTHALVVACDAALAAGGTLRDLWLALEAEREQFALLNPEQPGFTATAHGHRLSSTNADEDGIPAMRRRSLLIGAGAGIWATAGPAADTLSQQLGDQHVQAILDMEQRLYAQDRRYGAAELDQLAMTAVARANQWLRDGRYNDTVGRRLQLATGALSVTAGWLALDSGRTTQARSLYTEALVCARHADDPSLEAHAFGCLSLLATSTGHPREAVNTAQVAQRAAAQLGSPRWLSLLAMREARGWARQGDRALTEQALVRAYHRYSEGPTDADPAWLEFFVPAELAGLESLCRADLGQYERACAGAEQAVMLYATDHTRNLALYTADIALHHARKQHPDLDATADAAQRALGYLSDVKSHRLRHALDAVATLLRPHQHVRSAANYLDLYRHASEA